MVARSGLFVAPVAGVGASPTDARLALSALIGTTAQQASGGVTAQSASTMAFTVPSSVWQLPDPTNANATFLSATDPFTLTPAAGPGTGSRIDLLCVKQNNIENGDADSRANVILVGGTAGAPGVAPAVPTGAWLYQTITVPTSAANAAACTIVTARPSTYAPLPIKAATLALLNLVTGQPAQHATVTADSTPGNNSDYTWVTSWIRGGNPTAALTWVAYFGSVNIASCVKNVSTGMTTVVGRASSPAAVTDGSTIANIPAGFYPPAGGFECSGSATVGGTATSCTFVISAAGVVTVYGLGANKQLTFSATYPSA